MTAQKGGGMWWAGRRHRKLCVMSKKEGEKVGAKDWVLCITILPDRSSTWNNLWQKV